MFRNRDWFIDRKLSKKFYHFKKMDDLTHEDRGRMTKFRQEERPKYTVTGQTKRPTTVGKFIAEFPYYYNSKEYFNYEKKPVEAPREKYNPDFDRPRRRKPNKPCFRVRPHTTNCPDYSRPPKIFTFNPEERKEEERRFPVSPPPQPEPTNVNGDKFIRSCDRPKPKHPGLGIRGGHLIDPSQISYYSALPGQDTVELNDLHRRKAFVMRSNEIYRQNSGILPRYRGYVPGQKFRHSGTFGKLTYNAKEVGLEASKTWGGLTSIKGI